MNAPTTELIFPPRLISSLRDLRDADWAQLVDRVAELDISHVDRMAFELMVVRWSGCVNCQSDSFRAMQGCAQCAAQAVHRYRGNRADLERLFFDSVQEVKENINKMA